MDIHPQVVAHVVRTQISRLLLNIQIHMVMGLLPSAQHTDTHRSIAFCSTHRYTQVFCFPLNTQISCFLLNTQIYTGLLLSAQHTYLLLSAQHTGLLLSAQHTGLLLSAQHTDTHRSIAFCSTHILYVSLAFCSTHRSIYIIHRSLAFCSTCRYTQVSCFLLNTQIYIHRSNAFCSAHSDLLLSAQHTIHTDLLLSAQHRSLAFCSTHRYTQVSCFLLNTQMHIRLLPSAQHTTMWAIAYINICAHVKSPKQ